MARGQGRRMTPHIGQAGQFPDVGQPPPLGAVETAFVQGSDRRQGLVPGDRPLRQVRPPHPRQPGQAVQDRLVRRLETGIRPSGAGPDAPILPGAVAGDGLSPTVPARPLAGSGQSNGALSAIPDRPDHIGAVLHALEQAGPAQVDVPCLVRKPRAGGGCPVVSGKHPLERRIRSEAGIGVDVADQAEQFVAVGQPPVLAAGAFFHIEPADKIEGFFPGEGKLRRGRVQGPHEAGDAVQHRQLLDVKTGRGPGDARPMLAILA